MGSIEMKPLPTPFGQHRDETAAHAIWFSLRATKEQYGPPNQPNREQADAAIEQGWSSHEVIQLESPSSQGARKAQ